ncbi:MAG TPA: hypothetical protein VMF57_22625 [Solirubrobacteraceae bacterium]|nr:hypothetical protein [Solirubrobacteraceae bacterium]
MAVDRLPEGLREGSESDREHDGLEATAILSMCDHLVGEVGRRSHMFGWLRVPDSGQDEWLAVDAYYPRSRLVVMCRSSPEPYEALYRERIPAHGLGLLTLNPVALGDDAAVVQAALARRIGDLKHSPPPASRPPREPRPDRRAEWTPVTVKRTPLAPAVEQALGVIAGLILTVVLFAEIYLAVVAVGLQAGRPLLGLAIALEACSRGLGTAAAERAGERGWACACALGGAPVVVSFALSSRAERAQVEPAPLAALLALLAGAIALLALLIGI